MKPTKEEAVRWLRKLGVLPTGLVELSTATLSDAMQKLDLKSQVLEAAIRPVAPFTRMAGTAVTVKLAAASKPSSYSRLIGQAFESGLRVASPVLVVEYPPDLLGAAVVGSGGAHVMRNHFGFAGCVVNGAIRDTDDLLKMKFAAFARFVHPEYIFGIMEGVSVNQPVVVGGVEIRPGDFVVGDNDGVVAIPPDSVAEVIEAGKEILRSEQAILGEIDDGSPYLEVLRRHQPEAFNE
ncbi:MAG: RraA family protein [Bryobacteraceae bacterium]